MIISCSSCQTMFKVDETRLASDGTKVRCSKCGHVWHVTPGEQPAERVEPVLSARDENDREDRSGGLDEPKTTDESDGEGTPEKEKPSPDGLTDEQRAKLAAARQKKPGGGFRTKVLFILLIVSGVLAAAYYVWQPDVLKKINQASQQPADVGEVDAMPVPAEPEKGGHIVGGEPPPQPAQ
ncbi:MAG: zinc-ribbon domain-containing protein [Alphaproteobacteria bacterium]|nr:zinc-ribbon domain-containing protein [Alphaproteobacteria bacterium]